MNNNEVESFETSHKNETTSKIYENEPKNTKIAGFTVTGKTILKLKALKIMQK